MELNLKNGMKLTKTGPDEWAVEFSGMKMNFCDADVAAQMKRNGCTNLEILAAVPMYRFHA